MSADTAPVATTSKSTWATLTKFDGPSSRLFWNAETMVVPLSNMAGLAIGVPANSVVLPPLTEAMATTLGSKPSVTE